MLLTSNKRTIDYIRLNDWAVDNAGVWSTRSPAGGTIDPGRDARLVGRPWDEASAEQGCPSDGQEHRDLGEDRRTASARERGC